jgi:hypothetical protein
MYLHEAAANQGFADSVTGKVALLVLTAIIGFVGSYVLEQYKRRREPHKQISWDMRVERGLVAVSPSVKERVQILYRNSPADNLHAVRFKASNTGNRVIKNQYIRFEFGPLTTMIDEGRDPPAPRELGVEQARTPDLPRNETRYVIKHLERRQEVDFLLVVAGKDAGEPVPYHLNDEGDVDFIPRDVARVTEDIEHVQPFAFWLFLFLFVPSIFGFVSNSFFFFFSDFSGAFVVLLRVVLLIPVLLHLRPVTRLVQRCVSTLIADVKASQEVRISGGRNFTFLSENSTLHGDISFGQDESNEEKPSLAQDGMTPNV